MRYFLTGGAGFIGSHIIEHLLKNPGTSEIIAFDNFSSNTEKNLDFIDDNRLVIINSDLNNFTKLMEHLD